MTKNGESTKKIIINMVLSFFLSIQAIRAFVLFLIIIIFSFLMRFGFVCSTKTRKTLLSNRLLRTDFFQRQINVTILGNGFAGAENQCSGLTDRLQEKIENLSNYKISRVVRRLLPSKFWKYLPPSIHIPIAGLSTQLTWIGIEDRDSNNGGQLRSDPCDISRFLSCPDVVIASGRTTAPACAAYKRASAGRTYTVQIQHPRCSTDLFDAIVVPLHDLRPRWSFKPLSYDLASINHNFENGSSNIVATVGSVHRISAESLNKGLRQQNENPLFKLRDNVKVVTVLIGGPISRCRWDQQSLLCDLDRFIQVCQAYTGGRGLSLLISLSRRSPEQLFSQLQQWKDKITQADPSTSVFIWDPSIHPSSLNPYQSMLYHADVVAVTADSVGMCSEACSTGKPVVTLLASRCTAKLRTFHDNLTSCGYATRLEDGTPLAVLAACQTRVLDDTSAAADLILPRILQHYQRFGGSAAST